MNSFMLSFRKKIFGRGKKVKRKFEENPENRVYPWIPILMSLNNLFLAS
jgi:hypothetical protein